MRNGPYELVRAPEAYPGFKYRGRYVYEHQLVWWETTGQLVPVGSVIHHKNEKKRDNRFENLELLQVADHNREHHGVQNEPLTCGWCGEGFELKPSRFRTRSKRNSSGELFCSRSCGARFQFNAST